MCQGAHTAEGQRARVPFLQTGPPCRHLLAPRAPGLPERTPQAQRKGGHPFRAFEFVEDAPRNHTIPYFSTWRITPQKLSTASRQVFTKGGQKIVLIDLLQWSEWQNVA